MKFMKKIFVCALIFILSLTGCQWKESKDRDFKIYAAMTSNNTQGIKELLETEDLDLENLPFKMFTSFCDKDRRALAIVMDSNLVRKETVKLLVDAGADVNSKGDHGETYLNHALWSAPGVLEVLLESGADPTVKDGDGYTAMDEWICEAENQFSLNGRDVNTYMWERVDLLSKYGGDITPATLKLYLKNDGLLFGKQLIEKLRENGEKIGIKRDLEYAVCGEDEELLKYLDTHKVSNEKMVLRQAAAHCNIEVLRKLKEQGCDFTVRGKDKETLAHIAARYNSSEVLSYVIEQGVNPESVTEFEGYNALAWAVAGANQENIRILMKAGVPWQREGMMGVDIWSYVCRRGKKESVKLLLEEGQKPIEEEVLLAYQECNETTLEGLIQYGISYNMQCREPDTEEWTTGYTQLCAYNPELAKRIYSKFSDPEITQEAFEYISSEGSAEFIRQVLSAYKDSGNDFLEIALDDAVARGDVEMITELVEEGADVNKYLYDEEKHTVMHTAVGSASIDIFTYLLKNGGDLNRKDGEGNTVYDYIEDCPWKEEYLEM